MLNLLLLIKNELSDTLEAFIPKKNIYITSHIDIVPYDVRFPCIGIKDANIKRTDLNSGWQFVQKNIQIVAYVEAKKNDEAIIGNQNTMGILELSKAIQIVLDENNLKDNSIQYAFCTDESGSEAYSDTKKIVQRKVLNFVYHMQEKRPAMDCNSKFKLENDIRIIDLFHSILTDLKKED